MLDLRKLIFLVELHFDTNFIITKNINYNKW